MLRPLTLESYLFRKAIDIFARLRFLKECPLVTNNMADWLLPHNLGLGFMISTSSSFLLYFHIFFFLYDLWL